MMQSMITYNPSGFNNPQIVTCYKYDQPSMEQMTNAGGCFNQLSPVQQQIPSTPAESLVNKLDLGQHIIRYLKAFQIVAGTQPTVGVTTSYYYIGQGEYYLLLTSEEGSHEKIEKARSIIKDMVSKLCTQAMSMSYSCIRLLKGIKNIEIVKHFQEASVHAGWYANETTAEVFLCSDNFICVKKAFSVLDSLVREHFRTTNKVEHCLSSSDPGAHTQLDLSPAVQRYLNACYGFRQCIEETYNVKVGFDINNKKVNVHGEKSENTIQAVAYIKQNSDQLSPDQVNIAPEHQTQLQLISARYIVQQLNAMPILAGWHVEECQLFVCSDSLVNARRAIDIILWCCVGEFGWLNTPPNVVEGLGVVQPHIARRHFTASEESLRYMKTILSEVELLVHAAVFADVEDRKLEICSYDKHVAEDGIQTVRAIIDGQYRRSFEKSREFIECFKKQRATDIVFVLRKGESRAGWSSRQNKLWLCSDTEENIYKAELALTAWIIETEYPAETESLPKHCVDGLMFKRNLQKLAKHVKQNFPQVSSHFDYKSMQMRFACCEEKIVNRLLEIFQTFFSDWTYESTVKLANSEQVELVSRNVELLEKKCKEGEENAVTLELHANGKNLYVFSKVSKEHAAAAGNKLKGLLECVVRSHVNVDKKALRRWLKDTNGQARIDYISRATATVCNVYPNVSSSDHGPRDENDNVGTFESTSLEGYCGKLTVAFAGLIKEAAEIASLSLREEMQDLLVTQSWKDSPFKGEIQHMRLPQISDSIVKDADVDIHITRDDIQVEGFPDDVEAAKIVIDKILQKLASDLPIGISACLSSGPAEEAVLRTRKLNKETDVEEYKLVQDLFHQTSGATNAKITEVMHLSNTYMLDQYNTYKDNISKELEGDSATVLERQLWHGTKAFKLFCHLKFVDCDFGNEKAGKGIYFSTTSLEALNYSSRTSAWEGYMFLAKVVTGRYTESDITRSKPEGYHSVVDSKSNPTGFVVHDLSAAYPEYLIKCCWRGHI